MFTGMKKPSKRVRSGAAKAPSRAVPGQRDLFEKAAALFHAGEFERARELFVKAQEGDNREMTHSARLHARMCEQRIASREPELRTPEDHYNYAITLVNRRELGAAERHLNKALSLAGDQGYLHYAMALCRGLQGDIEGAYQHLRRSIELEPRHRVMARNDPDFQEFAARPPLRSLLGAGAASE